MENNLNRKIRIAHFAAFCPQRTGQYATVKDMIQAERAVGLDAQFVATSVDAKRVAKFENEVHTDGWLQTVGENWARKADIFIRHSCIPEKFKNLGIPIIMTLHGRPESTFLIEYVGLMKIYKMISEVSQDYRYKGWITFWEEHKFYHSLKLPEDDLYYVPAMVDLEEYNPEGVRIKFGEERSGSPNIIIADMWRHDITPYNMLYAAALFKKKYCPGAKVQIFGVPEKKADSLIWLMKNNGVVGNMMHTVKPMSNVYRGGDLLITPHNIATRIVRESLACGLPIVAGSSNKYTHFRADPRDIESFAEAINACWTAVKASPEAMRKQARETAEREFSVLKAGEAVKRACISILRKEVNSWEVKENVSFRKYKSYEDYVKHQTSKMKNVYSGVGKDYTSKYRESLFRRVQGLKNKSRLRTGMSVLCLGARDGTEVLAFRDAGYFAVGLDLLPVSNELVLKGDFQKLQFPESSVDIVFMNCLDHVYDLDKLLAEITKVLKPGGVFIVDFADSTITGSDRWGCCKWKKLVDIGLYIKNRGFYAELIGSFTDGYFNNMVCFRSSGGLHRVNIINSFIRKHSFKSYLEIGVRKKETFNRVKCESKVSVDPNYDSDYKMTSDNYFSQCNSDTFDCIFIDGLHTAEQVYRDITNAVEHLTDNGVVLVHDCNPPAEFLQRPELPSVLDNWCGDAWKAIARVRMLRDDLTCYVINRDYGIGVIYKGGQTVYSDHKEISELDWEYLQQHREELLRVREPEQWMIKQ